MTNKPLTLRGVRSYVRHEVLTLPNLVTGLRFYLVYEMIAQPDQLTRVTLLALTAWLSDGVDGWLAKRFGWCSKLGATLDQWADWSLGVALLYTIFNAEHFTLNSYNTPLLYLISGYLVARIMYWRSETTKIAKRKTFVQFLGGVVILAGYASAVDWVVATGYLILTCSLPLMVWSLWTYHVQGKQNR